LDVEKIAVLKYLYEIFFSGCGKICGSITGLLNPSRKYKLFEGNYVRRCLLLFDRYVDHSENEINR
jgi:hypothetical protein